MNWEIQYSNATVLKKPLIGELLVKFPTRDGAHIVVHERGGMSGELMEMRFQIKPENANFVSADGGIPRVRLYFQRAGDNWSGAGSMQYYRWWSNPASVILAPGKFTLSVPLRPEKWSSVYGKFGSSNPLAFRDAMRECQYAGFTLGGNFFAHGVWATNPAKLKVNSFKVK